MDVLALVHRTRMQDFSINMKQKQTIVTQMRLEAMLASSTTVVLDAECFRRLSKGDTLLFNDDSIRTNVVELVPGVAMYLEVGAVVDLTHYVRKEKLVRRVIPTHEVKNLIGDAFKEGTDYVTPLDKISSYRFLLETTPRRTFLTKMITYLKDRTRSSRF